MVKNTGTVIQVVGPVLDIRFPDGQLPDLLTAIEVPQGDRVIVSGEFTKDGKNGSYGFDYEKNAAGEYELKRMGEGVRSDDLM